MVQDWCCGLGVTVKVDGCPSFTGEGGWGKRKEKGEKLFEFKIVFAYRENNESIGAEGL